MKIVISLIAGVLFGFGLSISQMTNPAVVIGFLDITGQWNIQLGVVMFSALLTTTIGYFFIFKCKKPLLTTEFLLPTKKDIDKNLIIGSIMFGVGWGLVGLCPGPALTDIITGSSDLLLFTSTLCLGVLLHSAFVKLPLQK